MRFPVSCLLLGAFYLSNGVAGGFQLWEQDASGIGDYHAGAAAEAMSAGTQFFNPAGMVNLKQPEVSGGIAYIPLDINYSGTVGTLSPASTTANSHTDNFVPNFYAVYPFGQRYAFGFGVTVPFGSSTEYPINNPIADAATKTNLQTVNLNPSLAVSVSRYFSIAAGFDALYGKADYNSAFYYFFTPPIPLENELTGWAYGWNGGLLFYPTDYMRLGISYRSKMQLDGRGESQYVDPLDPIQTNALSGIIQLPATTILSFYSDINKRWAILFSAFYTQWSALQELELKNVLVFGSPTTISVFEDYQNSWNFALGVHYWLMENFLMLKVGAGYDETPTQTGNRDVRLPDAPKYALAIGLHMDVIRSLSLDLGWTHFFVKNTVVDNHLAMQDDIAMLAQTTGAATTQANVVGFQITWKI